MITWVEAEAGRLRETRADAGMVVLIARRALDSLEHPRVESNGRTITRNGRTIVERPRVYRRLRGVEWRRLREALERIYDERDRGGSSGGSFTAYLGTLHPQSHGRSDRLGGHAGTSGSEAA